MSCRRNAMKNNTQKLILIFTLIISIKIIAQNDVKKNDQTENFVQNKGKYPIPLSKYKNRDEQCAKIKNVNYVFEITQSCDDQRIEIIGTEDSFL